MFSPMRAARKTSPLGVAAPGEPFPLSCRHHDGRHRRARAVLFPVSTARLLFASSDPSYHSGKCTVVCTYCMDVLPWRYRTFRRPSIFGYVAFFVFLVLGVWTATQLLINTSTLGRCWSALFDLPPRFGHDFLGGPVSPGTLPNSRGPVKFPCGLRRQRDHLYLYQNSQRSPLWSSHQVGARRPFVSDLRWGRVIKLGLMRGTDEGQMHRPSLSDVCRPRTPTQETGPLLSLAVEVMFQLPSGGASGQKRGHRPKNRHRAPTQATAYFFAGNPLVDSGGLSAPWFIAELLIEVTPCMFSVTQRGGATAPLELWIQLACSEGPFVPLGLKHLEGRGTICYSAVEGPFVPPPELARSEGRFGTLGLELVALPVVRALSSDILCSAHTSTRATARRDSFIRSDSDTPRATRRVERTVWHKGARQACV